MAVALDATSQGTVSGAASLTISHTVGSGSNRYLLVAVICTNSTDYLAAGSCTYGGVSMGSPVVTKDAGASNTYTYVWGMVAPASGTANVVITPSGSAYLDCLVMSFTGVDQATPVAATAKDSTTQTSPGPTLTIALPTNGLIADFFTARATGQTLTPGTNQTRAGTTIAGGVSTSSGSTKTAAADMAWSGWAGSLALSTAAVALAASVSSTLSGNVTLDDAVAAGTLGSSSSDLSGGVTLADVVAAGTLGLQPGTISLSLVNENNGPQASITIPWLTFQRLTDAVQVLALASQSTNGAAALTVTNGALVQGTWYVVTGWHTDGTKAGVWVKQAT